MNALQLLQTQPIYRRYWITMLISNLGNWMQNASQAWLALQLSGSAEALGSVVALLFLPSLIFALPSGQLADRVSRPRIIFWSQSLMMLLAMVMTTLIALDWIVYWHLLLAAFVHGTLVAIDLPARQAMIVELVGKEHYPQAMPLNSFAFNLSRLVGPALAGVCIANLGMAWSYAFNSLSFVPILLVLPILSHLNMAKAVQKTRLLGGLDYVRAHLEVRHLLLVLAWVSIFGMNFQTLIPAYSRLVLHLEVAGYGLLSAALGLGALSGSLWQIFVKQRQAGYMYWAILALAALQACLFLPLSVAAVSLIWLACGFAMSTLMIHINTHFQNLIPDDLRGRLMALYSMVLLGAGPLGAWLTGYLFDRLGGHMASLILGCITAIGAVGLYLLSSKKTNVSQTA